MCRQDLSIVGLLLPALVAREEAADGLSDDFGAIGPPRSSTPAGGPPAAGDPVDASEQFLVY